ncbi:MAG: UDP-N-acetylenolpyruvoylglucosamine reductase, partial [Oscillospiraceae bacterium]|nr:UDP-N-acetylenolpyruvoylglucosamine reductase [Oscillospiraceae bacterium]
MGRTLADAVREKLPQLELRENEPLANHTSFKIGGPSKAAFFPKSTDELRQLCALLRSLGEKPLLLGNGSNV